MADSMSSVWLKAPSRAKTQDSKGILGIDPGLSGGIAFLLDGDANAWKMPETERDIFNLLANIREHISFAYIEKVASHPKQGVVSVWKFGQNNGFLRGCLIALGIPFEAVAPGVWQKNMGCLSKGDKNVTKRRAQELFPTLKITHAIADALLIAEYGRRIRVKE